MLGFALAASVLWQTQSVDVTANKEILKASLDATGLRSTVSQSGLSHLVSFENEDKQTRTVFVQITPSALLSWRSHLIYTTVWTGKEAPDEVSMRRIFSFTKKFGAFYIFKDSQGTYALRFGVNWDSSLVPTPAAGPRVQELKEMIQFVNQVGEEAEKLLATSG